MKLLYTFLLLVIFNFGFSTQQDTRSHYVLVSVAPHKFFVDQIAKDTIEIGLLVPAGASSHTFEPSPKLMHKASHADAWFILGESFENRAMPVLKNHNPKIEFIDLRKNISLITDDHHMCCCCHGADPHIWLSPKLAKIQATTIAETLIRLYPENQEIYEQNLKIFLSRLDTLDQELKTTFSQMSPRVVLVGHPAYGYLARDYGFRQLSIEFEGKDPTPKQLTDVLLQARKEKIMTVYVQPQYSSKGAKLVAKELHANVVTVDPYSEDFIHSLQHIAKEFACQK